MHNDRKVVLFIATSLDGYIATTNESLDWLYAVDGEGDNGYSAFVETIDTVLLGKKTYDWIMKNITDEFPYKGKECFVFTNSTIEDTDDVKFINENLLSFMNQLKKQEGKNIWIVGGGNLVHSFLEENVVDELILTIAPTLIGDGIPLFKERNHSTDLSLKGMKQYNQFVELHYEVKR